MVTDVMRASARQSFDRLSEMTVGEVARAVTTTEASPSAAARVHEHILIVLKPIFL